MSSLRKVFLAATLTVGGVGLSPAKAAIETWDFLNPTGALGTTENYLSSPGGFTLQAAGFLTAAGSPVFTTAGNLFGKNGGGDENGLGLASLNQPPGEDNEITTSQGFVRVGLPTGSTNIIAQLGSTTNGEFAEIFGSTQATTGYASLGSFSQQLTDINLSNLCASCSFFAFFGVGTQGDHLSNILISTIRADVAAVPLPGAVALFGTGLGLMGLLGWRRKRKLA
jgi:hypothetical protein